MSIRFNCPNCNKAYKVKDEMVGKRVRCTGCQQDMLIPSSDGALNGSRAQAGASAAARPKQTASAKACPKCKTSCAATAIICMHCGFNFQTGKATEVGMAIEMHEGIGLVSKIAAGVVIIALLAGAVVGALYGYQQLSGMKTSPTSAPADQPTPGRTTRARAVAPPIIVDEEPDQTLVTPTPESPEPKAQDDQVQAQPGRYGITVTVRWRDEHGQVSDGQASTDEPLLTLMHDGIGWSATVQSMRWTGAGLDGMSMLVPMAELGQAFDALPGQAVLDRSMLEIYVEGGLLQGRLTMLGRPVPMLGAADQPLDEFGASPAGFERFSVKFHPLELAAPAP